MSGHFDGTKVADSLASTLVSMSIFIFEEQYDFQWLCSFLSRLPLEKSIVGAERALLKKIYVQPSFGEDDIDIYNCPYWKVIDHNFISVIWILGNENKLWSS